VNGFVAVLQKEAMQMIRDKGILRFAMVLPLFQLILFGLIDTNVRYVPTVVYDQSRTAESRAFLREMENTSYFRVTSHVGSREAVRDAIVAGRAQVGVEIPPDFTGDRLSRGSGDILVLIDGSDSSISSQALSAANGVALSRSIEELQQKASIDELGWRIFPQLLFNPDSRSANLLIPGLVAILLMFSGTMLASFAIVRERERGTLEQLMVTPVSGIEVILGKLFPYLILGCVQVVLILTTMRFVFQVPIHGNIFLLGALSVVYLFALLALGLMVSSHSSSQMDAMQRAQGLLLPSVFLSGYVFPLASLPEPVRILSNFIPATHFIQISRGIIIRGADLGDLWVSVLALLGIATLLVIASTRAFQKTLA